MKFTCLILLVTCLILTTIGHAQNQIWSIANDVQTEGLEKLKRSKIPKVYRVYKLDLELLKTGLENAPVRFDNSNVKPPIINFPNAQGVLERYKVLESPVLEQELARKFPGIKTYVAQGIDDPTAYMRFSITQFGLHTMVLSGNQNTFYSDPYTSNFEYQIVYTKHALGGTPQNFECLTDQGTRLPSLNGGTTNTLKAANDQFLRTFRLAQSCTAEYGNLFANAGTEVADIQAQMAITVNRVNSIYEVDLGLTLVFIANNDLLIYYGDVNTDPWNGEWNTTTQATIDAAIPDGDYDIGHNFNTQGGGNAGCIGCVCVSGQKGSAYTGGSNPTGDAFDVDYVAHEMGHQLNGYHTMNTCSRSGSGATEVEPASGSSIMSYAGICATNVQPLVDAHLNYVNVRDISWNYMAGNSTCAALTALSNTPPTADAGNDYTIPTGTAFVLEGSATDPDGLASLTYNWSQNDPEQAPGNGAPQSTWSVGPLFRAKAPVTSPTRWMPQLSDVIAGNLYPTWEVVPDVGRTMNFSFIVRDNDVNGAQTGDDLMLVTVDGAAGPFQITSQTTGPTWTGGSSETITWNVANTDGGGVNTPNVDIFLSLDGGYTYPTTLASNVPNSGSANINVPGGSVTSTGRVMVRGANNIFYAINSSDIIIQSSEFAMNNITTPIDVCPGNDAVFSFTYNTYLGFSETTAFATAGEPAGSTIAFSPTTATTDATPVQMTISGITSAMVGTYNITITGTASTVTKTTQVTLNVLDPVVGGTALSTPVDGATGVNVAPAFGWSVVTGAGILYAIDIATDAGFTSIVEAATGLTTNSYTSAGLSPATTYYWRVTPGNACSSGSSSSTFSFTTGNCSTSMSADVPISIPTNIDSVFSTLTISATGTINDVNVLSVIGMHSWVGDLTVVLRSPAGTRITLWDQQCSNMDDFDLNFDDAAATGTLPCPPVGGGTYIPLIALSGLNGEDPNGVWTLIVKDNFNQDGGSLDSWGLEICATPVVCIDPDVPTIAGTTAICDGNSTTLTLTGNLNNATAWQWYSGSCGGTSAGSGTSITVSPAVNTTYYVRGEGACVTPGTCSNITVTVNPSYNTNENVSICNGQNYTYPDGTNGTITEVYTSTLTTSSGCDSIIVTNLTVNPVYATTITAQFCSGDTYTFPDGATTTVTASNVSSLTTVAGCDSTITTNATAVTQFNVSEDVFACDGDVYTFPDGTTATSSILHISNLTSSVGCDSIITSNLTVWPAYSTTVASSICNGSTYTFPDGSTSTVATQNISSFLTINGCDSIITTDLSINPVYNIAIAAEICDGASYTFPDGSTSLVSTTNISSLITVDGCDSIITTALTVNPVYAVTVNAQFCSGDTYTFPDGTTTTVAGSNISSLTTLSGCDSIITTNVTVVSQFNTSENVFACNGDVYTFPDGTTASASIVYVSNLISSTGCDSIITSNLTVLPSYSITTAAAICDGDTYIFPDGSTSNITTQNISSFLTVNGCDSIITTNLGVSPVYNNTVVVNLCGGSYTFPDGSTTSTSTSNTSSLFTVNGCDSIIVTQLTINPVYNNTINIDICNGGTYNFPDGTTSTVSTTNVSAFLTISGCDSTITTNLNVNPVYLVTESIAICPGQSYTYADGTVGLVSEIYTSIVTSTNGCDSIIVTTLTVQPEFNTTYSVDICDGETHTFPDGSTSGTSTTNISAFVTIYGCDSTITTNLNVNPAYSSSVSATICSGEVYTFPDGTTSLISTMQTSVFTIGQGCDSTIITTLIVDALDITTNTSAQTITANETNASYQWIDCSDQTIFLNETSQSFTASVAGNYAVILNNGNCLDTSACVNIVGVGLSINQGQLNLTLYPNPTRGSFTIGVTEHGKLVILDVIGQVIYQTEITFGTHKIDALLDKAVGVYTILFSSKSGKHQVIKLIKD